MGSRIDVSIISPNYILTCLCFVQPSRLDLSWARCWSNYSTYIRHRRSLLGPIACLASQPSPPAGVAKSCVPWATLEAPDNPIVHFWYFTQSGSDAPRRGGSDLGVSYTLCLPKET